MSLVTYNYISVDVNDPYSPQPVINIKQGDTGRGICATLYSGATLIDPTALTCQIWIKKPDGTKIYNAFTVSDKKIWITLTNQVTAVAGKCKCEIMLTYDTGRVTSHLFDICVWPTNIDDSAVESQDDFSALESALAILSQYDGRLSQAEADIDDAELDISANAASIQNIESEIGGLVEYGTPLSYSRTTKNGLVWTIGSDIVDGEIVGTVSCSNPNSLLATDSFTSYIVLYDSEFTTKDVTFLIEGDATNVVFYCQVLDGDGTNIASGQGTASITIGTSKTFGYSEWASMGAKRIRLVAAKHTSSDSSSTGISCSVTVKITSNELLQNSVGSIKSDLWNTSEKISSAETGIKNIGGINLLNQRVVWDASSVNPVPLNNSNGESMNISVTYDSSRSIYTIASTGAINIGSTTDPYVATVSASTFALRAGTYRFHQKTSDLDKNTDPHFYIHVVHSDSTVNNYHGLSKDGDVFTISADDTITLKIYIGLALDGTTGVSITLYPMLQPDDGLRYRFTIPVRLSNHTAYDISGWSASRLINEKLLELSSS